MLPAHIREAYPVFPTFAQGQYHLHRQLSDDLYADMLTYKNAVQATAKLDALGKKNFDRKMKSFLSKKPRECLVNQNNFNGCIRVPSPESLQELYTSAEKSPLKPYGYSNGSRYAREVQSVEVHEGDNVAFDWTFQVVKNYANMPDAKALFTGMKGSTKEVFMLALVSSTAANQVSHCLNKMKQARANFKPSVIYNDTCPNLTSFFQMIFGVGVAIRLGLFHLIQRIFKTLDTRSGLFWNCLVELQQCIYEYDETDLAGVIDALKQGNLSNDGRAYSDAEIEDLRRSKRWKQRYSQYLRKRIFKAPLIVHKLSGWIVK